MKTDRKLLTAVLILIVLVVWLLILSINKSQTATNIQHDLEDKIQTLQEKIEALPDVSPSAASPVSMEGKPGVDGHNATDTQVQIAVNTYMSSHYTPPANGANGASAYELAVQNGFTGTLQQWLDSLKVKGDKGDPAYELQLDCQNGHIAKKYSIDLFWQPTVIRCEVDSE